MSRCLHCGKEVTEGTVVCPRCGEVLVKEDGEWMELRIQGKVEEVKDRANMYIILAIVLVTLGIIGGSLLLVSSSPLGFFGVVFVCLGIGCTAAAYRHERKASSLRNQLSRSN
ncbi:MAG TPA: zinc-ribbon domain-containing protein [Dehalococcoidia bacterium]|nr:zinc-ribbon domain-containing protein [Dehalococcoidia bacterium]